MHSIVRPTQRYSCQERSAPGVCVVLGGTSVVDGDVGMVVTGPVVEGT